MSHKGEMIGGLSKKGGMGITAVGKTMTPEKTLETGSQKALSVRLEKELKRKEAILAVLGRLANDTDFQLSMADDPADTLAEYYILTQEDKAALASGDLSKIEGWVGKLDHRLATWLWCRLARKSGKKGGLFTL